jgi:cyclic-di-AMP phosphodiesterase PgpH
MFTLENRIDSLFMAIQPVLDSYVQWERAKQDPNISAENDSIRFSEELAESGVDLDDPTWDTLAGKLCRCSN